MTNGILYVIGTPIGNLKDITERAVEVLDEVEVLVCEDTRVSRKLINHLAKKTKLKRSPKYISYGDYNARSKWKEVVDLVSGGAKVGLVSDAGMPMISDPGFRVVRGCYDRDLEVEVIPGVSSVSTSLVMAGLGGNNFMFVGFLPKKSGKRVHEIERLGKVFSIYDDLRAIIYASPYRLIDELKVLNEVLGEGFKAVVLREMTKKFEERVEGSFDDLIERFEGKRVKGEIVVVVGKSD